MAELSNYKCSACGGALKFSSTKQKLICVSCETEYEVSEFEQIKEAEGQVNYQAKNDEWNVEAEGLVVYECKNCGGEVVGDKSMGSTKCPYCDNPIVISSKFEGSLKPDLVIPFKLNKKKAIEELTKHVNGVKLAPNEFKSGNHIKELKGVYVPFWLFDADVHARGLFDARKEHKHSDSQYNYTEISHYDAMREGDMKFTNVPADASEKMADDLMDSIEPYNVEEAVPYSSAYMAGYFADRYDVTAEACVSRADKRMENTAVNLLQGQVKNYDSVSQKSHTFNKTKSSVKYALFPVWILNTVWNGNKYTFAMNGQTGKLVGDVPCSMGKFWALLLSVFAVLSGIFVGIIAAAGNMSAKGAITSMVIALIIALVVAFVMKGKTKSVHMGTEALNYVVPGSFRVTNSYDNFIRKEVKKTPKNQNNK